jgi:Cu2+-containing amine oxidase
MLAHRHLHAIRLRRMLDCTQSGCCKSRIARNPGTRNFGLHANLCIYITSITTTSANNEAMIRFANTCILANRLTTNRLKCMLAHRHLHAIRLHRMLDCAQSGCFKSRRARNPGTRNLGLHANLFICNIMIHYNI